MAEVRSEKAADKPVMPSDSSPDTDRDFDPSAETSAQEYDDEQTLDEEEGLSNSDGSNELDALQQEGDMPMEDLMAMYGYSGGAASVPAGDPESRASSSEEEILSNQDLTLDKDEIARDLLQDDEDRNKETSVNDLLENVDIEIPSETHRLLRSANSQGSSDEDSEDLDYQPVIDEDWKKTISVGSDYQAQIPASMQMYGDAPAYENEDRLLWDPSKREDREVEGYLRDIQESTLSSASGVHAIPQGTHIRDDEQGLYLLLQCGHNVEEASRRRKMQSVAPADPMSLWSEEECRNFETGLKMYGKDFYLIQQNKVRTRSVGELVQFYYLWKKTERHDAFTNKNRLEKKKYALHPGVTDYMDRFLDEQENPAPVTSSRERSSSPNINSLIYGDPKRQHQATTPTTPSSPHVDIPLIVEMVQKVVHPQELDRLSSELSTAATSAASLPGATTTVTSTAHHQPASSSTSAAAAAGHSATVLLPSFTSAPPPTAIPTVPSPPSTPPDEHTQPSPPLSRKRESPSAGDSGDHAAKRLKSGDADSGNHQQQQHTNGLEIAAAAAAVSSIIDSVHVAIAAVASSVSDKAQQQQQSANAVGPPQSTSPPVAAASD